MAGEAWATIRAGGRENPSIIDTWSDISPGRRRDLKIAVRNLETLSGKPLGSIPFEPKAIEGIFRRATPASGGLSAASFQSYRSWIRFCLRRLGLLAERRRDCAFGRLAGICRKAQLGPALGALEGLHRILLHTGYRACGNVG